MSQPVAERKTMEILAEDFVTRYRRGERPSLSEYIAAHPELAGEIRQLFPTLVLIEELAPSESDASAPGSTFLADQLRLGLGDYRILREIGRGGMGTVYEAEQLSLGRHVALKVLHRHACADETLRQRFHREARAAAQLHHTNIVPVFDVGEDQDACWYAMQLILGQGLDQIIEELRQQRLLPGQAKPTASSPALASRPALSQVTQAFVSGQFVCPDLDAAAPPYAPSTTSTEQVSLDTTASASLPSHSELSTVDSTGGQYYRSVARIGRQAAEALAHAHARGIIHRDVKPSNLLLDAAGVVWITDFGLAKTQETSLTTTGDVVGTLGYMAPERFQGEGDERADVYGLGLTLYELLALRPGFDERDRLRLIDHIKSREPVRPRALDRRIPRDLETIVLKAIDKEATRRYATAEALAEDLRRFLANEPIRARRTSLAERTRLWCRRNPAVAFLVGAVFLLLICLTAGSLAAAFRLNQERAALVVAEQDRTEKLYQSLVAQANASRYSRQTGQRVATLEAVRRAAELVRQRSMPAERLDELRNLAIAALVLPDLRTLRTWEGFPGGFQQWDADDSLRLYARSDLVGNISLRRIETDEELARLQGWRGEVWLRFSPGGRFLVAWANNRFRAWDVRGAQPRLVLEGEEHGFDLHPDGRQLLVCGANGLAHLHDLEDPRPRPLGPGIPLLADRFFTFDPAGERLAVAGSGNVLIVDARTGKVLATLPEPRVSETPAWHPSGNYLALWCATREIHVWDLKRRTCMVALKGCRNNGIRLAFTPGGDHLLSDGWEGMLRLWDWRTGRQVLQQWGGSNLRISAEGRLLLHGGSGLSLVELATGGEYRSFVHQSNREKNVEYWRVAVHPEGRLVAVAMSDQARLFDLETGAELACLPQQGTTITWQGKEALLTQGETGLFRWPLRRDEANPSCWRLGPPQRLRPNTHHEVNCDSKGDVIGHASGNGVFLLRAGKRTSFLGPHAGAKSIAISPDGKLAASGNHHGDEGLKVWETETGRLLVHFATGGMTGGRFSPDGKWLAIGGTRGNRLVKVGTWEERPLGPWEHGYNFSPDSSLLVVGSRGGVIRLIEPGTAREIARLEDPNQDSAGWIDFTPDGGRMLVSSDDGHSIHVWDLRAIRAQLAELGLDWDMPALPPEPPRSPAPLQVEVDLGDFNQLAAVHSLLHQATRHVQANKHKDALAVLRKAVEIAPRHAPAHNNLAWLLLTGPPELRDPAQALRAARTAVELAPGLALYDNTLGVALYRAGQLAEAIPVLERSLRESASRSDAFDLFFLAMCHHRLGDADRARSCRERGGRWLEQHRATLSADWLRELTAFQTEADAVLAQPPGRASK